MTSTLIKNARIINEGIIQEADVRITGQRISKVGSDLSATHQDHIIDAKNKYLLPGMIDDQVHFREPGLTHKGNIASESRASVAGGITSYMEMPNVSPATTSIKALENKYAIGANSSLANYSFYLGATENNIEQIQLLNPKQHCGVKVFMGASTGNLLVENEQALENIFSKSPVLIATHCESGAVIANNAKRFDTSSATPTIFDHPIIRDADACYASSSYAVSLAKKHNSHLHVLHITTEKELSLFEAGAIENKHITAEACVHHLWFCDQDYSKQGNLIKCNPAIKSSTDRDALIQGVRDNVIDIIATDHAPHTFEEKQQDYPHAPAGLPLVQHALLSLFDHVQHQRLTLAQVVEKTAHNPAKRYAIVDRGFIREGYFADLVLIDPNAPTPTRHNNTLYHCTWTPFDGHTFSAHIDSTWVNGQHVFDGQRIIECPSPAQRLTFNR